MTEEATAESHGQRIACVILKGAGVGGQPADLAAFAQACLRFSPQLALRGSEAVFLEIGKSRRLFSEESLRLRIHALARRFGAQARVAISSTAARALAEARYGGTLPLEALHDFASPFAPARKDAKAAISKMIEKLGVFGVRDLNAFAQLPASSLASRFGETGVKLHTRIHPETEKFWEEAWPGYSPPERLIERQVTSEESALEPLLFVMKSVIDRAMARLMGEGKRATLVRVHLELEKWSTLKSHAREWRISLHLPQGSTQGLLPILKERLDRELRREGLAAPVTAVSFEVLETVPGHGAQRHFFDHHDQFDPQGRTRISEEQMEAWNAIVGRLSHELGQNDGKPQVFQAELTEDYKPEKSWIQVVNCVDSPDEPGAARAVRVFKRPSRLLSRPLPLHKQGVVLTTPKGERWGIRSWEGPERLSSGWWDETDSFCRDYYQVITLSGETLWIFQDRESRDSPAAQLYLHGYFD